MAAAAGYIWFDFTPFLPWTQLAVTPWWIMIHRPIPTRVLVIDDEKDCRELVRQWLERAPGHDDDGWRVTVADGPALGCQLLGIQDFECVLLDLGMPLLAPRQVFDMVRDCAGKVPILVFSNNASDEIYDYCIAGGAAKFVPKMSVNADGLSHAVCDAMGWQALKNEASRLSARADEYQETAGRCRGHHAS